MAISTINQNGLTAPLTLTSPVLTSPAFSGTPTGTLVSANMPTGSVLQVVQGSTTGFTNTTSTSYVATNLTASITPKFSTSKILILVTGASYFGTNAQGGLYAIYRNTTLLQQIIESTIANSWISASGNLLDSPATTSSTTYTLYMKTGNSGGNVYWGGDSPLYNTITLMEIAG